MNKLTQLAQIVAAFLYLVLVEMRPAMVYHAANDMFENIITSEIVLDAYGNKNVVGWTYFSIISAENVEDCAKSTY